jgi:hypothetical protein
MLKKVALLLLFTIVAAFTAIQVVPYGRNHANPPVQLEPAWDSAGTRELAVRACYDCHSNQTIWPWYSNIAPISWLVQKDVEDGRGELNFSEWGQGEQNAGDAAETVAEGEMPPRSYLWLHPQARLSPAEKQELIRGLQATFGTEGERRKESEEDGD